MRGKEEALDSHCLKDSRCVILFLVNYFRRSCMSSQRVIIENPAADSFPNYPAVYIEYGQQVHKESVNVNFILSRPISGVSKFITTDGEAFFSPDGGGLFIYDSNVILFIDFRTEEVFHLGPPISNVLADKY